MPDPVAASSAVITTDRMIMSISQCWLATVSTPCRAPAILRQATRRPAAQRRRRRQRGIAVAVQRLLEHHLADDVVLGDAEAPRLLGDLFLDQRRAHESGADDIGAHAVCRAFFGDDLGKAD